MKLWKFKRWNGFHNSVSVFFARSYVHACQIKKVDYIPNCHTWSIEEVT